MEESIEQIQNINIEEETNSNIAADENEGNKENHEADIDERTAIYESTSRDNNEDQRIEHFSLDYIKENIHVVEKEDFRYVGEMKNEHREGFGICYYKNGDIFKGQWKNNFREGYGILNSLTGEIMQGELKNDEFMGFCENINQEKQIKTQGYYSHYENNFVDNVIVKYDNKIYEGAAIKTLNNTKTTIGKLTTSKNKKIQKIFLGEVQNYIEECGYGVLISYTNYSSIKKEKYYEFDKNLASATASSSKNKKENKITEETTNPKENNCNNTISSSAADKNDKSYLITMYLGLYRKKCFDSYLEMYSLDGAACFFNLENGKKNGIAISFTKDGKVIIGKAKNNCRHGPFFTFSNCHNLPKSSIRMEIFFQDFKCKIVDKMETSKKYLATYYPEYAKMLDFNYTEVISKLNDLMTEEFPYFNELITNYGN